MGIFDKLPKYKAKSYELDCEWYYQRAKEIIPNENITYYLIYDHCFEGKRKMFNVYRISGTKELGQEMDIQLNMCFLAVLPQTKKNQKENMLFSGKGKIKRLYYNGSVMDAIDLKGIKL